MYLPRGSPKRISYFRRTREKNPYDNFPPKNPMFDPTPLECARRSFNLQCWLVQAARVDGQRAAKVGYDMYMYLPKDSQYHWNGPQVQVCKAQERT